MRLVVLSNTALPTSTSQKALQPNKYSTRTKWAGWYDVWTCWLTENSCTEVGNEPKDSHDAKPGLNNLTSCHLLGSRVLFYDCERIPYGPRVSSFYLPAKHLSSACILRLIKLICFSHSHRRQWGVGMWRWDPLTLQWKPVSPVLYCGFMLLSSQCCPWEEW